MASSKAAVILTLLLVVGVGAWAQTPSITSLSVTSGITGTAVTIAGANFGIGQGTSTVTFNAAPAVVSPGGWSANSIAIVVPDLATTGNVVVTVGTVASNAVRFTVIPYISGLLVNGVPSNTGPIGSILTVNGTGFGAKAGLNFVTLSGASIAGAGIVPVSWSDQSVSGHIPDTATSGSVIVTIAGHQSAPVSFILGPLIASISPVTTVAGAPITIGGSGFGGTRGPVTFNGVLATVTSWSASNIVATVPDGVSPGPVIVNVAGQNSNGWSFTPTPLIKNLSPASGLNGTILTITGSSFGPSPGGSVSFNGTVGVPSNWNDSSITVPAPSGALTGPVVVTANGIGSGPATFTYTPAIGNLNPVLGVSGTSVTVTGTNFGESQGASTVSFNGTMAATTSWSNTSITAWAPSTALTGPVVVAVNGVASNSATFTYTPGIGAVSPSSGLAGTSVTIAGVKLWGIARNQHGYFQRCASHTYELE